jgi:hypothetical protein
MYAERIALDPMDPTLSSTRCVMKARLFVLSLVAVALGGSTKPADARLIPTKDAREGVFDAELVAIVRHIQKDAFEIEDVLLKTVEVGKTVAVPDFTLYSYVEGIWRGERVEHEITPDTRILMFLKRSRRKPDCWEVTHGGYCFFWVDDPAKVDQLRGEARQALDLRRAWEAARDIEDPHQRVAALWPFLWDGGRACCRVTETELQKAGAVAGDYIADRLPFLSHMERMELLADLGLYGGEKLHSCILAHLENRRAAYTAAVQDLNLDTMGKENEWQALPRAAQDMWGELYYGLSGLAKFKNPDDLPFIRDLATWAVKHRVKQTCDAALEAFREMPAKDNLPVIRAIWEEFTKRPYEGNELGTIDVVRALGAHTYPETVPILVKLLDDPNAGDEAHYSLGRIVGKDLGRDPQPWLDWCVQQEQADEAD